MKALTNIRTWDLIPWVVAPGESELIDGRHRRSIKRSFEASGKLYELVLGPSLVEREVASTYEFAGAREHAVLGAMRTIAVERGLRGDPFDVFTLDAIGDALRGIGRDMHSDDVCDAIDLLHGSRLEITGEFTDEEGEEFTQTASSSILPSLMRGPMKSRPAEPFEVDFHQILRTAIDADIRMEHAADRRMTPPEE